MSSSRAYRVFVNWRINRLQKSIFDKRNWVKTVDVLVKEDQAKIRELSKRLNK